MALQKLETKRTCYKKICQFQVKLSFIFLPKTHLHRYVIVVVTLADMSNFGEKSCKGDLDIEGCVENDKSKIQMHSEKRFLDFLDLRGRLSFHN